MNAIEQHKWGEIITFTFGELTPHQWECFRLALMNVDTEQLAQGVAVEYSESINIAITEVETIGVKVVQSSIIFETKAEMIVNIVVSERDYKTDMLKYLPLYERKSTIFGEVLTAYDREFRNTEQLIEVTKRNMFVDTAVEALSIFERDLGIKNSKKLSYVQRREQISSRNRAAFDQTTEETIKVVASVYSNGAVEVNKTETVGVYEIKFIGTRRIPDNLDGLREALDIVIPAHLGLSYVFTFNPWEFLQGKTWGDVSDMSWNDLRIWNEVS